MPVEKMRGPHPLPINPPRLKAEIGAELRARVGCGGNPGQERARNVRCGAHFQKCFFGIDIGYHPRSLQDLAGFRLYSGHPPLLNPDVGDAVMEPYFSTIPPYGRGQKVTQAVYSAGGSTDPDPGHHVPHEGQSQNRNLRLGCALRAEEILESRVAQMTDEKPAAGSA